MRSGRRGLAWATGLFRVGDPKLIGSPYMPLRAWARYLASMRRRSSSTRARRLFVGSPMVGLYPVCEQLFVVSFECTIGVLIMHSKCAKLVSKVPSNRHVRGTDFLPVLPVSRAAPRRRWQDRFDGRAGRPLELVMSHAERAVRACEMHFNRTRLGRKLPGQWFKHPSLHSSRLRSGLPQRRFLQNDQQGRRRSFV